MNLSIIDWAIVIIVLAGMIYSVSFTKGLMRSVTDFLSAGRTAGRYLISVSQGAAGLGAISIVSSGVSVQIVPSMSTNIIMFVYHGNF